MKHVFVGIDWGHQDNQVVAMDAFGDGVFIARFSSDPEGVEELCDVVTALAEQHDELVVGIEDPSRPVTRSLLGHGVPVYVVTPQKLAAYRRVHRVAPVKDDVFDAWLLADMLRAHRDNARRIELPASVMQVLRRWTRQREVIVEARVASSLALRALLDDYYPQMSALPWTLRDRVAVDLLAAFPDPRELTGRELPRIREILHRVRKLDAEAVLEILRGPGRCMDDDVLDACVAIASQKVEQLKMLRAQQAQVDQTIAELLESLTAGDECSDAAIVQSLPGAGAVVAATLLGEAAQELATLDKSALRHKSVAPVTLQTGKQRPAGPSKPQVCRRHSVNQRLSQAMYQLGNAAKNHSEHYRKMYARMRGRGLTHGRTCRQLADRMLDVLFAMLRDRTLYDPAMHGATRSANTEGVLQSHR